MPDRDAAPTDRVRKPLTPEQRAKQREAWKRHDERNREKRRERQRLHYENNREAIAERHRAYKRRKWKEHLEAGDEEKKGARARHNAHRRKWYAKHRARILAARRAWREKNRERLNTYCREYWRRNYGKGSTASTHAPDPEEIRRRVLQQDDVYSAAAKVVPKGIRSWRRDDIISEIVIAVLEGKLPVADIPSRAKDFIRAYNSRFSDFLNTEFNDAFHGAGPDHTLEEE